METKDCEMNPVEPIESTEIAAMDLLDNILNLEDNNLVGEQEVDECIYHLNKLAALLGLNIDLDSYNDDYLSERE